MKTVIVWLREDLRVADNPALARAAASGAAVVPVYIWEPEAGGAWALGGAARWWLHWALEDMGQQLAALGSRLIVREGEAGAVLRGLVAETGATGVYWNRCYTPWRMAADSALKAGLKAEGVEVWSGNAALLREPWTVATQAGKPYQVYTPYARACGKTMEPGPLAGPGRLAGPERWPESVALATLGLLPVRPDWAAGLRASWVPTRAGGLARLEAFLGGSGVAGYATGRDVPCEDGTSRLSPYLRFGQLGVREVAARLREAGAGKGVETYHREILWREFAYHVLYHYPETVERPLQRKFERFPWRDDAQGLRAWQRGRTGYPIVDAGMRQLWETGWMHNRVRMIVASFLVKHLMVEWQAGARWFWDTLVDADLASNTLGWQWAGGCGADAAPYFRIFNPLLQGPKFDADGAYVKRYVPELRNVPTKWLHVPWEMPEALQRRLGVVIGDDYPAPIVEHGAARARALAALATLKEG